MSNDVNLSNHSVEPDAPHDVQVGGSLPPRSKKHGSKNEPEPEFSGKKSVPLIQIILYTFLALIAAFLIFWLWQQNNAESVDQPIASDPIEQITAQPAEEDDAELEAPPLAEEEKPEQEDNSSEEASDGDGEEKETAKQPLDQALEPKEPNTSTGSQQDKQDQQEEVQIIAVHQVQAGETFYSITMKYYQSSSYMEYLASFNNIQDIREIKAGMTLRIPKKP